MKSNERKAKIMCYWIAAIGILLFIGFNWNFHLLFTGTKYEATVLQIEHEYSKCYQIDVEHNINNGKVRQTRLSDCTGETFLFTLKEGDNLSLWESNQEPYCSYVPFLNMPLKIFLLFFFVFVPLVFAIFGKA